MSLHAKTSFFALQKEWRKPQTRCLCHQEMSVNDLVKGMSVPFHGITRAFLGINGSFHGINGSFHGINGRIEEVY